MLILRFFNLWDMFLYDYRAGKERFVPFEMLVTGSAISCSLCKPLDTVRFNEVIPLLYLRISQPHLFLSKLGVSKKCQVRGEVASFFYV